MKIYRALLLCTILMRVISIEAATPLSSDSKKAIAISAFKGSLITLSAFIGGYALINGKFIHPSSHVAAYSIFTALGAVAVGWWRYNHVPESYYDHAYKELTKIAREPLITLALSVKGADFIEQIKYLYVRDSFPLVKAFTRMNYLYSQLQLIDQSLDQVLHSSLTDLHADCFEMQILIQTIQDALEHGMKQIKEETQFINEYNAQTSLALQQTQAIIAQAAYSQATATWVNALKD